MTRESDRRWVVRADWLGGMSVAWSTGPSQGTMAADSRLSWNYVRWKLLLGLEYVNSTIHPCPLEQFSGSSGKETTDPIALASFNTHVRHQRPLLARSSKHTRSREYENLRHDEGKIERSLRHGIVRDWRPLLLVGDDREFRDRPNRWQETQRRGEVKELGAAGDYFPGAG